MREIYLLVLSWLSPLLQDWAYRMERLDVASWIVDGAERAGSIILLVVSGIPFLVKKKSENNCRHCTFPQMERIMQHFHNTPLGERGMSNF